MNYIDFTTALPLIGPALSSILVLLVVAFRRNHVVTMVITSLGLITGFIALWPSGAISPHQTQLIIIDDYAIFFMGLILVASFAVVILTYSYMRRIEEPKEELYIAMLLATLGAMVMITGAHFASFFLGLELLTVSLYIMIAYLRTREHSLEAGIKYLILAAASSAFLLFGMALIYSEMGTMKFGLIADRLASDTEFNSLFFHAGLALMTVGIGFKLAVVPFHMWTPDIYEGAPAPVTAYIATVSKGAMFALLLRYFLEIQGYGYAGIMVVFSLIAMASMFLGNLLALLQDNIKRILAYSSIAHLGYLLVAFVAGGAMAVEAIILYFVAYFATTLGAFGIVSVLSNRGKEYEDIEDYRGLFWNHPAMATTFTAVLLSLAGIPLTLGFIGKYFVLAAGVGSTQWALVVILVINSAIGLFYYLRIVVAMFTPTAAGHDGFGRVTLGGAFTLGILTLLILWLGVYPTPLIELIQDTVASFLL